MSSLFGPAYCNHKGDLYFVEPAGHGYAVSWQSHLTGEHYPVPGAIYDDVEAAKSALHQLAEDNGWQLTGIERGRGVIWRP